MAILFGVFAFLTGCPRAKAQTNDEPEIVYLRRGEAAPFSGDLFPPSRSIRLGLSLEGCRKELKLTLDYQGELHAIALQASKDGFKVSLDAEAQRRNILQQALDEALVWHRSPVFIGAVAFVATIVVVLSSAYIAKAVLKAAP